ncbi:hypothetical protein KFL_002180165 [Klebsormidium nitens]|uniref:Uncharacterized protein n=1 Tax=Klebsormidium nitens TaxID=105231 RepID=A0A1Y1I510_KLENI|nr:hypothetical protein KFL_002180165 [Klebsormidium nitens]|eukprot:GAQ85042.1 hypothetical protein KFL_002180165 [Klebsormidium nitens]
MTILLRPLTQKEGSTDTEKNTLSQKKSFQRDEGSSEHSGLSSILYTPEGAATVRENAEPLEKRGIAEGTEKGLETERKSGGKTGTDTEADTESGLKVRVIQDGLKGSLHEEPGFVRWRDCVILFGSFNVSREQAPVLVAAHSWSIALGSTRTTIYNLTTGDVTTGPDFRCSCTTRPRHFPPGGWSISSGAPIGAT